MASPKFLMNTMPTFFLQNGSLKVFVGKILALRSVINDYFIYIFQPLTIFTFDKVVLYAEGIQHKLAKFNISERKRSFSLQLWMRITKTIYITNEWYAKQLIGTLSRFRFILLKDLERSIFRNIQDNLKQRFQIYKIKQAWNKDFKERHWVTYKVANAKSGESTRR